MEVEYADAVWLVVQVTRERGEGESGEEKRGRRERGERERETETESERVYYIVLCDFCNFGDGVQDGCLFSVLASLS